MNPDLQKKVEELEAQLKNVLSEQHESAKLLIRRDLALTRANEQLKALDIRKSEFISIAAHQLRTPLSAIKWIMHMLLHDEFRDEFDRKNFIKKASDSTDRLIALVNDLLEVDHIQSGKYQVLFDQVDVTESVKAVAAELQALVDARKISLEMDLSPVIRIRGDAVKLRGVFQNLIENAIKYTTIGGTVKISARIEGDSVQMSFTDSGIGIPDSQKIHIFTKFFRAGNAIRVDTVGSGLGLFIAKEVVERHGGKIWFESAEGSGTTFFVTLPVAPIESNV
ncbi:MAG: HAMP domain-containing sensor histidine kinase [Patescibacteria group bacterium]